MEVAEAAVSSAAAAVSDALPAHESADVLASVIAPPRRCVTPCAARKTDENVADVGRPDRLSTAHFLNEKMCCVERCGRWHMSVR